MGFEKFVDIVSRLGGLSPSAVVLVVTIQALKHHGGDPHGGLAALERGNENLAANLAIVRECGLSTVAAVNRFPGDTTRKSALARSLSLDAGAAAAEVDEGYERGGAGAIELAQAVADASERAGQVRRLYALDDPIAAKLEAVATRVYGAAGIELSPQATAQVEESERLGLGRLPVCIAKTHLSLSHDPALLGAPHGYTLPVRELHAYTGAGWLVAVCGTM